MILVKMSHGLTLGEKWTNTSLYLKFGVTCNGYSDFSFFFPFPTPSPRHTPYSLSSTLSTGTYPCVSDKKFI